MRQLIQQARHLRHLIGVRLPSVSSLPHRRTECNYDRNIMRPQEKGKRELLGADAGCIAASRRGGISGPHDKRWRGIGPTKAIRMSHAGADRLARRDRWQVLCNDGRIDQVVAGAGGSRLAVRISLPLDYVRNTMFESVLTSPGEDFHAIRFKA